MSFPLVKQSVRGNGAAFVDLPYPLPPQWQMHAAKSTTAWLAALGALGTLVFATAAFWAAARGDLRDLMVWALFFAGIGLATGLAFERTGDERRLPAMINAITLSRAIERPVDSWIHFFRRAGPSRWQTTFFSIVGFGASGLFGWASVLSFMTAPWTLLATVPLLLGSLFVAFAGVMAVLLRWRHSSFARRPIGLSLGRHGLDEYQSHALLMFTAVRFWFEHPDARHELSTTFAQRRIEGWAKAMSAP